VTDPAGKWKTSTVDAYGNVIQVTEPNPAGGTFTTNYTYTPGEPAHRRVDDPWQRHPDPHLPLHGSDLTSATNPENGTVTYTYDNSHHVTSRTDALGNQTQYTYDSYGRLTEVQYYPGFGYYQGIEDPSQRVTYYYDGNFQHAYPCLALTAPSNQYSTGRLSAVVFGGGIADAYKDSYCYQYAYTQPGRVATQQMMVAAPNTYYNRVNFAASYQWDDEGRMTSLQYPTVSATGSFGNMPVNMPIAAMQYDVNGRLAGMTMDQRNGQGPQPFASATYYATGQLYQLSYGLGTETRTYNSLMQLTSQVLPNYLNMTYNYSATQNNGRITSSVDGVTGESTSYSYDALNRLTNASNSLWSEAYTYDGFGNLTTKTGSGGSPNPAPTVGINYNSKNQPTNIYYDANGNQNACNSPQCGNSYSVENRMTLEVLGSYPYPANIYAYDPWGKRVMSGYNPNYNSPLPNYSYTFYGVTGQKLAMVTCNGSNYPAYPTCAIVGQNVYFGQKLITAGGVNVVTDRLGSVRANAQGESFAYYPYGEERTNRPDGREKFGTYFRDAIGQDYADQRYYGSGTGSFFTADPGGIKTANPSDPRTLNRYLYANADPVNFGDPTGYEPTTVFWDCAVVGEVYQCGFMLGGLGSQFSNPEMPPYDLGGGSANGGLYTGFSQALSDLFRNPDCANLIASNSDGDLAVGAMSLAAMLGSARVTASFAGNNTPVTFQSAGADPSLNTTYTFQTAFTSGGNIYLNANYFPDPSQENIVEPNGTATSLLALVNQAYGTAMDATQFGTFVFLHELSHIVDSTGSNTSTIDSTAYNQNLIHTCIH
jgi:RHS repeat-associated protein